MDFKTGFEFMMRVAFVGAIVVVGAAYGCGYWAAS